MARPTPGLIWGEARQLFAADSTHLRFAHADVSGFSLFEEAQYRGVLAAERDGVAIAEEEVVRVTALEDSEVVLVDVA